MILCPACNKPASVETYTTTREGKQFRVKLYLCENTDRRRPRKTPGLPHKAKKDAHRPVVEEEEIQSDMSTVPLPEGLEQRIRDLMQRSGLKWTPFCEELAKQALPTEPRAFLSYQTLFGIFKANQLWGAHMNLPKWVDRMEVWVEKQEKRREEAHGQEEEGESSSAVPITSEMLEHAKAGCTLCDDGFVRSNTTGQVIGVPNPPEAFPYAVPGFCFPDLDQLLQLSPQGREDLIHLVQTASKIAEVKAGLTDMQKDYEDRVTIFRTLEEQFRRQHLP